MSGARFMACRLSEKGMGTVNEILHTPADQAMDMWSYLIFREDLDSWRARQAEREAKK